MTEFEAKVLADLNVLRGQMDQLMGIGQPGRLHDLERRVSSNEKGAQRMKGFVGAIGAVEALLQVAIGYFGGRHH